MLENEKIWILQNILSNVEEHNSAKLLRESLFKVIDGFAPLITASGAGVYTDALTPSSEIPTEVGDKVFLVTQPGTYTNFGNVVLPENNFGFIFKSGNNFSIQSVEMPMQDLTEIEAKIDSNNNDNTKKIELSKTELALKFNHYPSNIILTPWVNDIDGLEILGVQLNFNFVIASSNKMEVVIFDQNFTKIVTSTPTEIIKEGWQHFGMPYTKFPQGKYYIGYANDNISDKTKYNLKVIGGNGLSAVHNFPISNTLSEVKRIPYVFDFKVISHNDLRHTGFEVMRNADIRMYVYIDGYGLIGYNTTTFKIVRSQDNGVTFSNILDGIIPTAGCFQILFHNNNIFWVTQGGQIWKSSKVNEGTALTWTDITPPLKNPKAVFLPTGAIIWKEFLWYGEYSGANTGELQTDGGPKIHRYNLATGVWTVSTQFPNGRHVHSFTDQGTSALYTCVGDAGWGSQVGYHRLTEISADGVSDSWVQWTYTHDAIDGNSHYPVTSTIGTIDGVLHLIGGADRPKMFINTVKLINTTEGQALINARVYNPKDADSGETMRNAILDARGNFYAITAESSNNRLMCSPPPYVDRYILADNLQYDLTLPMTRSGEYLFMENYRFKCVTFENQLQVSSNTYTENNAILFNQTNNVGFTHQTSGTNGAGKTLIGNSEINLYAKNSVAGSNYFESLRTNNLIDFTNINYINVVLNINSFNGTNPSVRLQLSTDKSVTDATDGKELLNTITANGIMVIQFDIRNMTGEKYFFIQCAALQVSELDFNVRSIWYE